MGAERGQGQWALWALGLLLVAGCAPERISAQLPVAVPEILAAYPYLEEADIREALSYAAWRVEETEVPIGT